jgi:formiminotetrahydrofolate cyclodeaminase
LTVAFAASLVSMVARSSQGMWNDAGGVSAQALSLRARLAPLAQTDATAWEEASTALRAAAEGEGGGSAALERALDRAAAVPLEVAELAADVAALAALVGENCAPEYRADAAAAAALAAGGARAAAHLVEVNLGMREGDHRRARALASADVAADQAGRVLATFR